MTPASRVERHGLVVALGGLVLLLLATGLVRVISDTGTGIDTGGGPAVKVAEPNVPASAGRPRQHPVRAPQAPPAFHDGNRTIFGDDCVLVAYYGTGASAPAEGALRQLPVTKNSRARAPGDRRAARRSWRRDGCLP